MEGRDTPLLSILICTLPQRSSLFSSLIDHLEKQSDGKLEMMFTTRRYVGLSKGRPFEILFDGHETNSTGFKRQSLLSKANGDYIAFIDDDDFVYDYYIDEMLTACASGADCFAINGIMTTDGQHETKWYLSKDFANEDRREGNKTVYYRHTNHITGVKRSIALAAGFPDKSNAEDKHYSDRLVLRSEYKIERPMYHYRFSSHNKSYK